MFSQHYRHAKCKFYQPIIPHLYMFFTPPIGAAFHRRPPYGEPPSWRRLPCLAQVRALGRCLDICPYPLLLLPYTGFGPSILSSYRQGHAFRVTAWWGEASRRAARRVATCCDRIPTAAPLAVGRNKLRPSPMGSRHLGGLLGQRASRPLRRCGLCRLQ